MNASTKQNIIDVAFELFAKQGFGQTSIREIAKSAEVNLSAINYHFTSKEGLYAEIMKYSFVKFETGISEINQDIGFENFVIEYYRFFKGHSNVLKNVFKLFIFDTVELENPMELHKNQECVGPPGSDILVKVLQKEVGKELPLDEVNFAVDTIATQVFHKALVLCSAKMEQIKKEVKGTPKEAFMSDERIEDNIRRITKLVLNDLRA